MKTCEGFYKFAYNFLVAKTVKNNITDQIINSYLKYDIPEKNVSSLNDIFEKMLFSAQSQNMYPKVIGESINGVSNLGKVLNSFDIKYVVENYASGEKLLEDIERILKPKGQIRRNKSSLWPKYCKTIVSVAKFLYQFKDEKEFFSWIYNYYNDEKSVSVLPLILSLEIYGFGFALACDFLKDLGFVNYGKPDVHIKDILLGYGFINSTDSDYLVLKKMINISKINKITCFEFDRILWLIGSGNFYNHKEFGNNGLIGRMKDDFILLTDIYFSEK